MNLEVGSTIGDYQVIDILGAGGMGKVYKVRNVISDRVEAMKVLLPDLVQSPELADRFLREIKVQASLEHPNIASLHTAVRVDNQLLMLMEFVEGITLEQRLTGGPLPVPEAVEYTRQVLAALDYAHQRGVIHRDIKPANMMLTAGGVVKLMDFGIAKSATDRRLTMTGTTMGSLYYMSPEQIRGDTTLDARADLYSVGVSLYEMVTGKRPFDGDSQFAIMSAHLEKEPVPPIQIDPRLPAALNEIILMSVMKDPNARFQGAAAFRNALSAVATPVAAPAPTVTMQPSAAAPAGAAVAPAPPAAVAARSKRGLWMTVGALAVALAVVGIIQFGPHKRTDAASQTGTAPSSVVPADPAPAQTPAVQPPAVQTTPVQQPPAPEPQPSTGAKPARQAAAQSPQSAPPAANKTASQQSAQPAAGVPQPAAQPATQTQEPAAPPQVPPKAPAVSPEQLTEARDHFMMLNTRASGIRGTLESLARRQGAGGLNLNARWQEPADRMDNFLTAANQALASGDLAGAKSYMDKAERQIEILEKGLNR